MNIKDFKQSLEYLFQAQVTPFVWGHAGIGKSTVVKQYALEKGFHFFPLYLGTQSDLGDILGLADFKRDKDGTAVATTFAMPIWLKECIDYCNQNPDSGAILFLDEFNRARRDVLNGMFSLALDKTFHTVKLPKNLHIIAAGNPPTDEYYVTDVNETALMARFVHIKLEPTVQEWVSFANDTKIEESLIGFIQDQPKLLEDHHSDFPLPIKVDRRSYERLDRLFKLNTPAYLLEQLMMGIIGPERTVAYNTFFKKQDKALSAEEVCKGKNLDKVVAWSMEGDIKASLLSITCDNLFQLFQTLDKNQGVFPEEDYENLVVFFESIPKDIAFVNLLKLVSCTSFRPVQEHPTSKQRLIDLVKIILEDKNKVPKDEVKPKKGKKK